MKTKNTNYKLRFIEKNEQDNSNEYLIKDYQKKKVVQSINLYNVVFNVKTQVYEYNSEWEFFDNLFIEGAVSEYNYLYKEWIINFDKLQIKLLPYIYFNVVYRNVYGTANYNIQTNFYWEYEKIENGMVFAPKLHISARFFPYVTDDVLQNRLLLSIANPEFIGR